MKSKSELYLEGRSEIPQVSALMAKSVSAQRREMLAAEVDAGLFRDGSGVKSSSNALTKNGVVSGFGKSAQVVSNGGSFRGSNESMMQAPEIYSPLLLTSNINFPRDRATMNAWCRQFFTTNAIVNNAISLHSTYPISKLNIKCANKTVEKFFNDMIEEIDLMNVCVQIAQEYWVLGEAFPYAEYDERKGKWSKIAIQNPDYISVQRTVVANEPMIMLRPDENLKRIVNSNKAIDIEQRKTLPSYIVEAVKRGQNIPLLNFNISHLARKISPYEIRGTGLPVCIFKQLALFDKLRESKHAQAEGMVNPLTLVKIGGEGADALHPTFADLDAWRNVFAEAESNKNYKIFTHAGVTVERNGAGQGIYDISGDITQLIKEIYIGLQVPPVLMDGGADTTYANGGVALDVLRQRYMQFRNMLSAWLKRKIFAPISKIQGFYEYRDKQKHLIIPEIDWNHMSLFDAGDYINTLVTLTQGGEDGEKRGSLHTLYRSMGLEYEDELRKIRKEMIQKEILKKEKEALTTMNLNELRSLSEDDEIKEPVDVAIENAGTLPGESSGLPTPPAGLNLDSAPPMTPKA